MPGKVKVNVVLKRLVK